MLTHEAFSDGHLHRVVVTRHSSGWQVRVERDNEVVRTNTYTDWHRVERALRMSDLQPEVLYSTNR